MGVSAGPDAFSSTSISLPLARAVDAYLDLAGFDDGGAGLIREAYEYAVFWHEGQLRKGGERPYVVHPITVARILLRHEAPVELVGAGLLHDVLEDTPVLPVEIGERFGQRVAELVLAVTRPQWRAWRLPPDRDAALLKAADLASNLADTSLAFREIGPQVWKRFGTGRRKLDRWNHSLRQVESVLGADPLAQACRQMLDDLAAGTVP